MARGRDMLLRVVPEEGQDVLPEDSTPWAKELPSPTSHSNRSLRPKSPLLGNGISRAECPSSNGLGQSELFRNGGSGSFGLEFRRLSTDVAIVAV